MIANVALLLVSAALAATPCAGLKAISLSNTTITMAELVPAGEFKPPAATAAGGPAPAAPLIVPAFCRVAAVLKPSSDSEIQIEVWLPAENWNGKFEAVGNGGWAGIISYPALATALNEGYATASTDTGHKGGNASFAIGHPEKVVDFAYRAVHEMTVKAKAITTAFYDRGPRLSYWNGCSTGGRQGLMEAQRYPDDFDAVLAGAPANYQTHLHTWDLGVAVPVLKDPSAVVSAAKARTLNKAVIAACDARDGVKDGLLNDPRACKFDLSNLARPAIPIVVSPRPSSKPLRECMLPRKQRPASTSFQAKNREARRAGMPSPEAQRPRAFPWARFKLRTTTSIGIGGRLISIET